jgi:hypothetical protein
VPPRETAGDVQRIRAWVETLTTLTMDDAGDIRPLTPAEARAREQQ